MGDAASVARVGEAAVFCVAEAATALVAWECCFVVWNKWRGHLAVWGDQGPE